MTNGTATAEESKAMRLVVRCLVLSCVVAASAPAASQSLERAFTIEFRYRAEGTEQLEDVDGIWVRKTTYDHSATMRCPVFSNGEEPISHLSFLAPETANQPPRERITGTRPLGDVDANITAETNLDTMQTRYAIVAAEADGFAREADDRRTRSGSMIAIPDGMVIAGPYPGSVKDGSLTRKVPSGEYSIRWTFARKP